MSANKIIIVSVLLYIVLFAAMAITFFNTKFSGNDAAGNGMAKGLSLLYGLGVLFFVAVVLTAINAFLFNKISMGWIKILFFLPILLPVVPFGYEFLEIGKPKPPTVEEQVHRLEFEIKTNSKLEKITFAFRTSGGGAFSKLKPKKVENNTYYYENSEAIFYEGDRKFYLTADQFETPEYHLEIPYKPEPKPFTDWETFFAIKSDSQDSIAFQFRYKITKRKQ